MSTYEEFDLPKTPKQLLELEELFEETKISNGWCFAGGCLRACFENGSKTDIDIFCYRSETFNQIYTLMSKVFVHTSTLVKGEINGIAVDLIYDEEAACAEDIVDKFDFTVCCLFREGKKNYALEGAREHLFSMKLYINTVNKPKAFIRRLEQYIKKGYSVTEELAEHYLDAVRLMNEEDIDYTWKFSTSSWKEEYEEHTQQLEFDFSGQLSQQSLEETLRRIQQEMNIRVPTAFSPIFGTANV